jgi:hypothetical protein
MVEGIDLTKIYCKHICKYHNVSSVQLWYANNNFFFKNGKNYWEKKKAACYWHKKTTNQQIEKNKMIRNEPILDF